MEEADLLAFWGKAQSRRDSGPAWHPLPYHALDVAAVGKRWLELDRSLSRWLARSLAVPAVDLPELLWPLLALHDLGKFAAAFQIKVPEFHPRSLFGDLPDLRSTGFRHDRAGYHFLKQRFVECFPLWHSDDRWAIDPLLRAFTGHHGEPPADTPAGRLLDDFRPEGIAAARAFCHAILALANPPAMPPDERLAKRASTTVAGFGIVCDWLGSNQDHFPYEPPTRSLPDYWSLAQERATAAVMAAGLVGAAPGVPVTLPALLRIPDAVPTGLQEWAASVDLPKGPLLILLEDETGNGKTEAALILASRLMAAGEARGLYTALPTMATANALFERLAACHRQLFQADATPSVALVHGRSHLLSAFRALELGDVGRQERYDDEDSASALCSAWLADDRRKALLADIGVGTIDQALLAILPVRFQALRLFGLAGKVLVLDEVHAYDSFVGQELQRLIEWQATLGGSCILLSATLPDSVRRRLLSAFRHAVDGVSIEVVEGRYPMATLASRNGVALSPPLGRSRRARRLPVRFLHGVDGALDCVRRAAQAGQAVAYIRNTVDDAIEAHAKLKEQGVDALLFHARMALVDRFDVERRILRLFGKAGDAVARSGRIVVATQVIEQSLDIDFDAMVTDLAPIDLIVQRAGRLWRHDRPGRDGTAELVVVAPDPAAVADKEWYGRLLPRARWVYPDHARLWLTADILRRQGAIETPDGIRTLIEAVYSEAAEDRIPEGLLETRLAAEGTSSAHRGMANRQILGPRDGYVSGGPWEDEARATTRLQDRLQSTVRLAIPRDGKLVPYASTVVERAERIGEPHLWLLSELQVAETRAHSAAIPPEYSEEAARVMATWGRFDQSKILAVLVPDEGRWRGHVTNKAGARSEFGYTRNLGLAFAPD